MLFTNPIVYATSSQSYFNLNLTSNTLCFSRQSPEAPKMRNSYFKTEKGELKSVGKSVFEVLE